MTITVPEKIAQEVLKQLEEHKSVLKKGSPNWKLTVIVTAAFKRCIEVTSETTQSKIN